MEILVLVFMDKLDRMLVISLHVISIIGLVCIFILIRNVNAFLNRRGGRILAEKGAIRRMNV